MSVPNRDDSNRHAQTGQNNQGINQDVGSKFPENISDDQWNKLSQTERDEYNRLYPGRRDTKGRNQSGTQL